MVSMWRKHLLAALVVSWAAHVAHTALAILAEPRVAIRQGVLKGKILISAKGHTFYAFQGIPFAKPPTGNLRFRAPERPAPWKGVLDATKLGPECIQITGNGGVVGKEDCLYLNVFTTHLPKENGILTEQNGRLLDVMFWIHGGAFFIGSGNDYPPQYLMDKNVLYVSTNYRLGVLGFLSTGDDESPGNYGMKDQTAALEWVQENIAAFGGNPNSVTIFGQSAGSISVHYHILSKLSKGLFHRAISMSGIAVAPITRCQDPLRTAQYQARLVNCTDNTTSALVDCLRHTDAAILIRTYTLETVLLQDVKYVPCPEKETPRNPKPFLTAEPFSVIRAGDFNKVPWIVGSTSQDFGIVVAYVVNNETLNEMFNRNFEYFCNKMLFLSPSLRGEEVDFVYQKFVEFYLNGSAVFSQQNAYQLIEGFTDRNLIYPVKEAVTQQYAKGQNKIFWYNFAYRGLFSATSVESLRNYGVVHSDDVRYLFPGYLEWPYTPDDQEVVELMLSLWTNFAKFGNPTPPRKPFEPRGRLDVEWLPVHDVGSHSLHMRYYNIGQVVLGAPNDFLNENLGPVKLNLAVDLHEKGMAFWESFDLQEN